jgi:hypothetical protein
MTRPIAAAIAACRGILRITPLLLVSGCAPSATLDPIPVVDLARELDQADRRPAGGVHATVYRAGAEARPSVAVPVPSRITWQLPIPRRAALRTFVAVEGPPGAAVRMRIGVSDHRIYEGLTAVTLTPERAGWVALDASLSAYAGRKWSLFYRPDRIIWNVVLGADPVAGAPSLAVWGSPEIVADEAAASEYAARRRRLAQSRRRH